MMSLMASAPPVVAAHRRVRQAGVARAIYTIGVCVKLSGAATTASVSDVITQCRHDSSQSRRAVQNQLWRALKVKGDHLDSQLHLTWSRKSPHEFVRQLQHLSLQAHLTTVLLGQQCVHVQLQGGTGSGLMQPLEVQQAPVGWVQSPDGAPGSRVELWEIRGQPLPH